MVMLGQMVEMALFSTGECLLRHSGVALIASLENLSVLFVWAPGTSSIPVELHAHV